MLKRAIVPWNRLVVVVMIILCVNGSFLAQQNPESRKTTFGGTFESLRPEQKQLLRRWVSEYNRINGKNLSEAKVYSDLPASFKTTFDAVTHALLTTNLTDANGKQIGTALGLIEMVETIHGQIHSAPSDHQFRVYVLLKKDGLDKLYASREFKRSGDNTVFHKGYPVNFRQQGGAPSIQFSVARTGRRADIDVDYRSSAAYVALFNGHLTAANSDVRAGNNYDRHVRRWNGFQNWWRNLLDRLFLEEKPKEDVGVSLEISDTPRVDGSKGVHEAIKDFFEAWLVERKPLTSAAYLSVKSYPCIVDFQDGSQPDSPLARARIVKHMRDVNEQLGQVDKLENVLRGAPVYAPGARLVGHPYGKLFSLEQLPDDLAYEMDCRIRLRMKLAEDIPRPGKGFSNFYGSIVNLKTGTNSSIILFQVWSKEGKDWKIVAWHLDHPFKSPDVPVVATTPESTKNKAAAAADDELSRQTRDLLVEWLLKHEVDLALSHLTRDALDCAAEELEIVASKESDHQKRVRELFTLIAKEAGKGKSLEDILVASDVSHEHLEPLVHPQSKAYVLARISDELSEMFHCGKKMTGAKFGKDHTQGAPNFGGARYLTIFQLKHAGDQPAAFAMLWEKQGNEWKVTAFDILAH
jgi:hypothetical protein